MKRTMWCMVAVSLLFFAGCSNQTTELGLRLKTGEYYYQTMHSVSEIEQSYMGQRLAMTARISGELVFLVTAENSGVYDMDISYNQLSLEMEMPMGAVTYSSENPQPDDIMSMLLADISNKTFQITMDQSGKVLSVSGLEQMWDNAIDRFPELDEEQQAQIIAQLEDAYGEEAFIRNLELSTAIYPPSKTSVSKRDRWNVSFVLGNDIPATVETEYRLTQVKDDEIVIEGKGVIITPGDRVFPGAEGMRMRYDLEGSMQSEIRINATTGWVTQATIEQTISGDVMISDEEVPEEMPIAMSVTNNISIRGK